MTDIQRVSHLLLDIEGTTCPVSFVAERLFPYAADRLEAFLLEKATEEPVQALLRDVLQAWQHDADPESQALWNRTGVSDGPVISGDSGRSIASTAAYLRLLIRQDRKLTALKDLQGLIWEEGYARGELIAPLFADVPPALRRWHGAGLVLGVYSSGSVWAQQLLYGHSSGGDLRDLFRHWFDTRHGMKQQAESYRCLARIMKTDPESVLFISDALAECEAAHSAGMVTLFSQRPDNPHRDPGPFEPISDYGQLSIQT